ncbi:hypothetical protein DL98DRAFT_626419 [Cadophora sp. DSE1049]|nr:hypothetical protein DL98DRAFT_626419 [Cadophora sp. DSE1049]
MYKAWVHTEEQQQALEDRYERLQRDEELDDAWKAVDIAGIQAVYQIIKYPGGIIILPYREKNDTSKNDANRSHKSNKSNIYLDTFDEFDAYSLWQDGRSENSFCQKFLGNTNQTDLSLFDQVFWKMIWQNGMKKLNSQLIFSACGLFGTYPTYTRVYRAPREPVDPGTKKIFKLITQMPVEIQLKILEALPLHRGDLEVRLYYPHLVPLWIETIPVRFHRYITRLLSTDNKDYIGRYYKDDEPEEVSDYANGVDVYRLQSLDNHRKETLRLRTHMATLEEVTTYENDTDIMLPVEKSSSINASKNLLRHLTRLFINDKENNLREAECIQGARNEDDIVPISCSRANWPDISMREGLLCHTCSNELPARPFLIPLSFSVPVYRRGQKKTPDQYLLIFEDELSEIFKNMEVAYRPIFWQNSVLRNLRRDSAEEREFAEWIECGCYTVELGDEKHIY